MIFREFSRISFNIDSRLWSHCIPDRSISYQIRKKSHQVGKLSPNPSQSLELIETV